MLLPTLQSSISKLVLGCALGIFSHFSHAGLMGQGISAELGVNLSDRGPFSVGYYPSIGPYFTTIGEGLEFSQLFVSAIDFDDMSFHGTFNSAHHRFGFNGFVYRLTNPGNLQIINVTFVASNIFGFDASRIHFTKDAFAIDMGGLGAAGHFIDLAIQTGEAVPEPSTVVLLGLGLAGLAACRRRKAA